MKFTSVFSLLLLSLVMFACGPEGEKVESGEAMAESTKKVVDGAAYTIDVAQSVVNWEGTKLIGEGHNGKISLTGGRIAVADGNIVGGDFTIDMTSIDNMDLEAGNGKEKLEGHLKSPDFFDVEQFPTAKFSILSAQPITDGDGSATHKVMGNFTMKGETRSIAIPVLVSMDGDMLKAASKDFVLDRTEWGVEYGSSNIADIAKDNIINDNIGLDIQIVAKK